VACGVRKVLLSCAARRALLKGCDGHVAFEQKILTEYGIEKPRVDGSVPSQATKIEILISAG
jgi:hypothetical protein